MPYQLRSAARPALDSIWFDELRAHAGGLNEVYTVLGPPPSTLKQLRSHFEASGNTVNPNLRPEGLDPAIYYEKKRSLVALRTRIEQDEPNETIRRAYCAHIDELLENISLLLAAHDHDDSGFAAANQVVYGAPDPELFQGIYAWLYRFVETQANHPRSAIRNTAAIAARALHAPVADDAPSIVPAQNIFDAVRGMHFAAGGYFSQLFAHTPALGDVTVRRDNGDPVVRQVLENIGSNYTLMDANDHLWGIVHSQHAIVRPFDFQLDREAFYGLVAHELGSHLLERTNGLRQPLRLLALGLDRYDHCNEGRAFLREQIRYDTPDAMASSWEWQSHILLHFVIGLACGLLDGHRYTFAEMYGQLLPICELWEQLRQTNEPKATREAATFAWNVLTRCLKGTDSLGGAYLKDTIYLEGNIRCWQAAAIDPEIILAGDLGKFDISRTDHWDMLRALDIVE